MFHATVKIFILLVLQAEHAFKLRVHVENEAADSLLSRVPLSVATYAASGTLGW